MHRARSIWLWLWLCVPSLVASVPGAVIAWWLAGGFAAAICVVASCLGGGLLAAHEAAKHAKVCQARLRRPDLRINGTQGTGLYAGLLEEAFGIFDSLETEARSTREERTKIEARGQVRQREAQRLEAALGCVEEPVLIVDARGQACYRNEAARAVVIDDAAGSGSAAGGSFVPAPPLSELLRETLARDAATNRRLAEFEHDHAGTTRAWRATATTIHDPQDDRILGAVAVLRDIGEQKLANSRHAEFVSSVCHELKTPMASIRAFAEMLRDGDVTEPDEQREVYGFIEQQVDRLTRLVNNMLNLARIESGVIEVRREDCELNDILRGALETVAPTAAEKSIRLIPELSELYLPVHPDRDLLGQAIVNLLSNAIKYTPAEGEVRLRSRMDEGKAVIEVRDNGMGIPAESLPRLFERFYRVPRNNQAAAGTGLGLALVQYIVMELHGGTIAVDSTLDVGTCFTLTLPLGHRDGTRRRPTAKLCTV
ncbi:MAG: ATP-binding protein [Planctomycetaceae bacterium]